MTEPNYYIEHNRKVPYSMSPIQINDTTTVLATVAMSPNEIEWSNWLSRNPNHKNSKSMLKTNKPAIIRTWNDYAFHMTMEEGRISNHFARLVIFENEKICCATKCIHNDFTSIQNCIRNLFLALRGSIMMFKKFEYAQLCYDCLMYLCSDTRKIEKLFNEYHATLTQWDMKSDPYYRVPFGKELHYLSCILFKYQSFTMYVLNHDSLWENIFSLFIFYMSNFKRLRHHIKDDYTTYQPTDHGYMLRQRGMVVAWYFEYTLNGILSIMRRLMCYLETKHLHKLIQMNYFEHFIAFTDDLFDLEYMRIIMDSMKPDSEVIFGGTLTLFQLLSVVQYINFQVMNKDKKNIFQILG
eukprot:772956_1